MANQPTKPYINVDFFEDLTGVIPETPKEGVEEVGRTNQNAAGRKRVESR